MTSCVAAAAATSSCTAQATSIFTCTSLSSPGLILPPPSSTSTSSASQQQSSNSNNNNNVAGPQVPSALFQQQFPQAIAISSKSTALALPLQDNSNNVYNGIFLVDGLGSGIRINATPKPVVNPGPGVHHHQYGLPAVHSSPTRQQQQHGLAMPQSSNPLCIRINSSTAGVTGAGATTANNVSNFPTGNRFGEPGVICASASQNYSSNGSPSSSSTTAATATAAGVVIPLSGTSTSTSTATATANSMPKYNRNSVTLSVPSPPLQSVPLQSSTGSVFAVVTPQAQSQGNSSSAPNLCRSPTFPGTARPGLNEVTARTNVTVVVPNTSAPVASPPARTLISTEAQTEDCPQLSGGLAAPVPTPLVPPPPPPSRGNREQRKRERRERRRDRNGHHHYLSHTSSSAIARNHMSGSSGHGHGHGHSSSKAHRSSSSSCVNSPTHNSSSAAELGGGGADHAHLQNEGTGSIPDLLLNSQMPPPYSTLPQHSERRLAVTPAPLSPHNMIGIPMIPNVNVNSGVNGCGSNGNGNGNASPSATAAITSQPQQGPMPVSVLQAAQPQQHGMLHPHLQMLGGPPQGGPQPPPPQFLVPPPQSMCHLSPGIAGGPQPVRYHFASTAPALTPSRTTRRSLRAPRGDRCYASEEEPKSCCGMSTSQAVSIRWFIIIIAVIGICCTVAGTALGAARSSGSQHLTLSLLMIGVGVVLLTVSAVAWRLTANDSGTSCRAMLGFARSGSSRGDGGAEPNRRFVPRLAPSYGRPHHPYAAMMYPDFACRPPPPSYNQSMQEYRLRLLLLERSNPTVAAAATLATSSALSMVPPPPAYRPYNGTLRPCGNYRIDPDYSRPPSYRSRSSGYSHSGYEIPVTSRPCLDPGLHQQHLAHHHPHLMESPLHSRDPSILSYLSQQSMVADNISVVSGSVTGSHHHRHHPNSQSVVTVMQAVTVGMDLGLDMSGHYEHSGCRVEEVHENKNLQYNCSNPDDDDQGNEKKIQKVSKDGHSHSEPTTTANEKTGSLNKDGNLVRIVQTTNSSHVIGRDTVIVTVSGSPHHNNNTLWEQHQHQPLIHQPPPPAQQSAAPNYTANNMNSTNNNLNHHHLHVHQPQPHQSYQNNNIPALPNSSSAQSQISSTSSTSDNNEVQILAHL